MAYNVRKCLSRWRIKNLRILFFTLFSGSLNLLKAGMREGHTPKSYFTALVCLSKQDTTCIPCKPSKTKFYVYLTTRNHCGKRYTEKTRRYIHERHGEHRSDIENQSLESRQQFLNCGIKGLYLQIIIFSKKGKRKF